MVDTNKQFTFEGFRAPHYTQIPDEAFDVLMPILSGSEWKVLCYIMRRTFGFKKSEDHIAYSQFMKGITTSDGRVLDQGAGVTSPTTLSNALKVLEGMGIITSRKLKGQKGTANEITVYELRFADPLLQKMEKGTPKNGPALLQKMEIQDTAIQKTVKQQTDSISNSKRGPSRKENDQTSDRNPLQPGYLQEVMPQQMDDGWGDSQDTTTAIPETPRLDAAMDEISDLLGEKAPWSNRTHARRLMEQHELTEEYMEQIVRQVYNRVKGVITSQGGVRKRGAYYFARLEDVLQNAPAARSELAGRYKNLIHR